MKKLNIFGGLFRTIFLTSGLCMLLPVVIVSVVSIKSFSKNLVKDAEQNLQQLSVEKMTEVDLMIKNQISLTKAVADSSYIQEDVDSFSDGKILTDYLGSILKNANGLYENFFITRQSAGLADCLGGATLHDVAGEPWYEECKRKGEFLGNNISPVTGRPVYVISYGIYNNGKFVGGLNNSIDLAIMTSSITGSITDANTKVLIIDIEGNVIASENSDQILKTNFNKENDSTSKLMQQMRSSNSGSIEFFFDGTDNIGAFSNLGSMYTLVYMPKAVYAKMVSAVVNKIILLITLCIIAAFVLIFFITASITRPISVVDSSIHGIASGDADLTKRISIRAKYEVKSLVEGFNLFSKKMQGIIGEVKSSQNELTAAGNMLQESTYDTESSITQILANITSVNNTILSQAAIVDGTADSIKGISDDLENLSNMIGKQNSSVKTASEKVNEMLETIVEVNQLIGDMARNFDILNQNLSIGMEKQNDVTKLVQEIESQSKTLQEANVIISGIASQTNLLAMNAAIEAAHAGDSGKGFSVVADEIRKLSETSTTQSKKITEQLNTIQTSIVNVVTASEESQKSFAEISGKIGDTDVSVKKIREAMDKQQEGSKQISSALNEMNTSTKDVMMSSGEISSESNEILNELKKLQNSSFEMRSSIEEMEIGAQKINETGEKLSEIATQVRASINKSNGQIEKFKI